MKVVRKHLKFKLRIEEGMDDDEIEMYQKKLKRKLVDFKISDGAIIYVSG